MRETADTRTESGPLNQTQIKKYKIFGPTYFPKIPIWYINPFAEFLKRSVCEKIKPWVVLLTDEISSSGAIEL